MNALPFERHRLVFIDETGTLFLPFAKRRLTVENEGGIAIPNRQIELPFTASSSRLWTCTDFQGPRVRKLASLLDV